MSNIYKNCIDSTKISDPLTVQTEIFSALSQFTHLELTKEGLFADVVAKGGLFLLYGHFKGGKRKLISTIFDQDGLFSLDYKRIGIHGYSFLFSDPISSSLKAFQGSFAQKIYFYPGDFSDIAHSSYINPTGYARAHTFSFIGEGGTNG